MNTIRKSFTMILVLILCLSLFACGKNPVMTTVGTNPPDTGGKNTTVSGEQTGTVDVQTLRSGNWNTSIAGTDFNFFIYAEGGYYYQNNGFLHFFDPASRIDVTLCQKAGCPHENGDPRKDWKNCEASIKMNAILCYDDGYLFYDKEDHGQHLYRRNADGTAETYIATLWKDYAGQQHDVQVANYILSDGILYYTICVSGGELDMDGTFVVKDLYRALLRLDLASGKEEEILRLYDASIGLIAAKKDAVVYATMGVQYYDVPSGSDRLEAMLNTPRSIHLWTKDANTSQELLRKPYREFSGGDSFEKGRINIWNEDTYCTYDLVTGESAELPASPDGVTLNEQYCALDRGRILCNRQTGETLPNEFADKCPTEFAEVKFRFFAPSEEGIFMERDYCVEGNGFLSIKESYISYISFDSLADGLQIQDATDIDVLTEKR